ncbi:MAG: hypothetical protein KGJ35_02970 [Patescibacteria group bacterium]|nr:hypothetical protein [Patescibacteria group bacterium]
MKSSELMKLSDLTGWKVVEGYMAELKHGLMGYFPAVTTKDEQPFVCLDKEVLKKILGLLSKREFKVEKLLILANEESCQAFCLGTLKYNWEMERESETLDIITAKKLEEMNSPKFFKWAPGLIGDDMSTEEFQVTLEFAMSNI